MLIRKLIQSFTRMNVESGSVQIVVTRKRKRVMFMSMWILNIAVMKGISATFAMKYWDPRHSWEDTRARCITEITLSVLDVENVIVQKMYREDGVWKCSDCDYFSNHKGHTFEHIEAKHVQHSGYQCEICQKIMKTFASLRTHKSKYHKDQLII